ncbi:Adenylate kinase 2 [Hypoxylon texense]
MKKTAPFSRLFDSTSVVEIDEEWLYNYPSFLSSETAITDSDIPRLLSDLTDQAANRDTGERFVVKGAKEARERLNKGDKWFEEDRVLRSVLADVPKSKRLKKQHQRFMRLRLGIIYRSPFIPRFNEHYNHTLAASLLLPRTATNAKKRFIWHPNANANTALICYIGSSEEEKPGLSQFFDRHWNHEAYFFDETTMTVNTWETEFHLSFYRLLGAHEFPFRNTPLSSKNPFSNKPGRIAKTSMGFRFMGDFFDRYWTCHFIEDLQSLRSDIRNGRELQDYELRSAAPLQEIDQEQSWRQRKVLELYLFERILNSLVKCTQEILDKIRKDLGVRRGQGDSPFTNIGSEDYFFSSIQWNELQSVLQEVDENLEDVKLEISKWETREKDRGQERPRWTRNDERKYGGIITKVFGSTKKEIRNFHSIHTSVKSLKENLVRRQEQTRQDVSLRGSEDIRFFTYVTVVFLPLGFASSIFSMNGVPGPDLVNSLVVCATAALVITIFALFNAKTLGYIVYRGLAIVESYSRLKMERSALMRRNEGAEKTADEEALKEVPFSLPVQQAPNSTKDLGKKSDGAYVPQTTGTAVSSRFWFLVVYTILELPARRVAMTYDVLVNGKLYLATLFFVLISLETDIRNYMRWLVLPLDTLRPMRRLRSLLKATRESKEKQKKLKEKERKESDDKSSQEKEGGEDRDNPGPAVDERQLLRASTSPPTPLNPPSLAAIHPNTFSVGESQRGMNGEEIGASSMALTTPHIESFGNFFAPDCKASLLSVQRPGARTVGRVDEPARDRRGKLS